MKEKHLKHYSKKFVAHMQDMIMIKLQNIYIPLHMEWHCQLVALVGGMALPHCACILGVQPQWVELSRGREFKYKEQDQAPSVTSGSNMEGHATYAAIG